MRSSGSILRSGATSATIQKNHTELINLLIRVFPVPSCQTHALFSSLKSVRKAIPTIIQKMIFRALLFAFAIENSNAFYLGHMSHLNDLASYLQVWISYSRRIFNTVFQSDLTSNENPLHSPFIPFNKRDPADSFLGNVYGSLFRDLKNLTTNLLKIKH